MIEIYPFFFVVDNSMVTIMGTWGIQPTCNATEPLSHKALGIFFHNSIVISHCNIFFVTWYTWIVRIMVELLYSPLPNKLIFSCFWTMDNLWLDRFGFKPCFHSNLFEPTCEVECYLIWLNDKIYPYFCW